MKKLLWKLCALILAAALMLSGCQYFMSFPVRFRDMEYTRPDMTSLEQKLTAVEDLLPTAQSAKEIMPAFFEFYGEYEAFVTNYSLAYIHYCQDMTDIYWEQEYNYCLEQTSWVDAAYDQLLYALADTDYVPQLEAEEYFGADFFDNFQGESLWDEGLMELMDRHDKLLSQYYALSDSQDAEPVAEIFLEMVALRQEMAEYSGYPDYPSFAYDFYHARDYSPQQAEAYMNAIQSILTPLYRKIDFTNFPSPSTEKQTLSYVTGMAKNMGGVIREAASMMTDYDLYDITPSENKYNASFEIYLYSYQLPFIFINGQGNSDDKLTLTHEFGHFCQDYASYGYGLSIDVAEFFSQGLEYLSLFYAEDGAALEKYKMYESLCLYVEQAAYASFEHQVYGLKGDQLTRENVDALFAKVMSDFGLDYYGTSSNAYVQIPHFFISPMYVISYVISNDAAMQIYQLEKAESGAGKRVYEDALSTEEVYFLAFIQESELQDPFSPSHLKSVRDILQETLIP